ncbi:hypothetical protein LBMAG56_43250 [Verrucomicrobiota bacterium]|nr:hypothetical protein LBMAG56_43250 [Verrucomicrobiota bacterium]
MLFALMANSPVSGSGVRNGVIGGLTSLGVLNQSSPGVAHEWVQDPITVQLGFRAQAKVDTNVVFSVSILDAAVTGAGAGCAEFTNATSGTVTIKPRERYILSAGSESLSEIVIDLVPPTVPDFMNGSGGSAKLQRGYKVYVDGIEKYAIRDSCTNGCGAYTNNWEIEVRKDTEPKPSSRRRTKAKAALEDNPDELSETTAPGDGDWLSMGPGMSGRAADIGLKWSVAMGRMWNGKSAGRLWLAELGLSSNIYSPAALTYNSPSDFAQEITVIRGNTLCQIKTPQTLLDVVVSNQWYELRFYQLWNVGTNTSEPFGRFPILNDTPFVTWRIENPDRDAGLTNRLWITEFRNGTNYPNKLAYRAETTSWELTRGNGNDLRSETRYLAIDDTNGHRWETNEVRNAAGQTASKIIEHYQRFPWRWELVSQVTDPDGAALTTEYAYNSDPDSPAEYGQLRHIIYPDGFWEKRQYYPYTTWGHRWHAGALSAVLKPWKDGPTHPDSADIGSSMVTAYSYALWGDKLLNAEIYDVLGAFPYRDSGGWNTEAIDKITSIRTLDERLGEDGLTKVSQSVDGSWVQYGYHTVTETFSDYTDSSIRGSLSSSFTSDSLLDVYYYDWGTLIPGGGFTINTNDGPGIPVTLYVTNNIDGEGIVSISQQYVDISRGVDWRSVKVSGVGGNVAFQFIGSLVVDELEGHPVGPIYLPAGHAQKEVTYFRAGHVVRVDRFVGAGLGTNAVSGVVGPVFELIDSVIHQRDSLGHITNSSRIDGASGMVREIYSASWRGPDDNDWNLKLAEMDETGGTSRFVYDSLRRLTSTTRDGTDSGDFPGQSQQTTTITYNAFDAPLSETTIVGAITVGTARTYDMAGRLVALTTPAGTTNYTYLNGGRTTLETWPGGASKVTDKYLDRRVKSLTGDAVTAEYHDYDVVGGDSVMPIPKNAHYTRPGRVDSPRILAEYKDRLSQLCATSAPGLVADTAVTNKFWYEYWTANRLLGYSEPGKADVTVQGSRWDMWHSQTTNSAGVRGAWYDYSNTRRTGSTSTRVKLGDSWFLSTTNLTWLTDGNAIPTPTQVVRQRLNGFAATTVAEVLTIDASGHETRVVTTVDRAAKRVRQETIESGISNVAVQITINGLLQSAFSASVANSALFYYDDLGRATGMTTPQGITLSKTVDLQTGQLLAETDATGQVTSYEYYSLNHPSANRLKCRTAPSGKKTYYAYDGRGNITHTWGNAIYPERRVYNEYGEMIELHTFRGGTNWIGAEWPAVSGSADITRWYFHEASGLLTNKTDASGLGVTYAYDEFNRLVTTLNARNSTERPSKAANFYNQLGDLVRTDYDDGARTIVYDDFDRCGRPRQIIASGVTNSFAFDAAGRTIAESGGGWSVSTEFHPDYGKERLTLTVAGGTNVQAIYGYDPATGRLLTATQGDVSATYAYATNNDVVASITFRNGSNTVLTTTKVYEFGSRLKTATHSLAGAGTVDGRDYLFDALQRRTRATEADGAYWAYSYDDRSQLTAAKHYWPDNSPIPGQQFEFAYDPIGNRTVTATGGNQSGQNLRSATWQANELNQLVSRDVPSWLPITGEADSNAFVTVNCETPFRRGEFFHRELAVNNASSAVWQAITNTAVFAAAGPEGADIVEERRGNIFVPPAVEQPAYDADGNLTTDSRWSYTWDAENRLTGMETRTNVAAVLGADFPRKKLAFTYDHQGRRSAKTVSTWDAANEVWANPATTRFVYDGWLLLAELDATQDANAPILTRSYLWGLDLSGTFDQAGGIGGLLAISNLQSQIATHLVCSDANGNVTALVNAGSGQPSARYDYAPFGELLRASGEAAALNPFRFSSKYADAETGLLYYGYRYYSPSTGKWINRDPAEEEGGVNLYAFVENNPINAFDPFGTTSATEEGSAGTIAAGGLGESGAAVGGWSARFKAAVGNLERVNDIMEVAMDMMDFMPGNAGLDFLTKMAEFRGDAIKEGLKNGHTRSTAKGQLAHNLLSAFIKKNGGQPNAAIGSGYADGVIKLADKAFNVIVELKPNNPRAIARGKKQLAEYMKGNGNAVGIVLTY